MIEYLIALAAGMALKLNDDLADMFQRDDLTKYTKKLEIILSIMVATSDFATGLVLYSFNVLYSLIDSPSYQSDDVITSMYFFPLVFLQSYKTFEIPDFFNISILICWFIAGFSDVLTINDEYSILKLLLRGGTTAVTASFIWYFSEHISSSVLKIMLVGMGYTLVSTINQSIMLLKVKDG